ncbi:MAG: polysaccharide deacetylase family protein [Bacteroidia bacterium]
MIQILIPASTPRLSFTLDLIFSRIIGIPYEIIPLSEWHAGQETPLINYTQLIIPEAFSIPNAGIHKSTDILPVDVRLANREIPYLFHYSASGSSYQLEFDIFSAVFYLATDYEKYIEAIRDSHDRFDLIQYPSNDYGLQALPLVHIYCEELWEKLCLQYTSLASSRKPPVFDYRITWDIDFPWKYFHKDPLTHIGGFFKDIRAGEWKRLKERTRAWLTGKDPNDSFSQIYSLSPPDKTIFFFLIDRNAQQDSRFTWRNPHLRALIRYISDQGYTTGIHPSYSSYLDPVRIQEECQRLREITDKPVTHSRQHFLRYRLPDTFRYLAEAGIEQEFTLCRFQEAGFPCGMAVPFPWYDLLKDEMTDLILWPTLVMDRTLQQYLGLGPEEAVKHFHKLLQITRRYKGMFTILLHNDVLSESEEWKGWREPVSAFLKELAG